MYGLRVYIWLTESEHINKFLNMYIYASVYVRKILSYFDIYS